MDNARKELLASPEAMQAAAEKYFEMTPEAAATFKLPIINDSKALTAADVQKFLDAMVRTGMQPGPLNGADFVADIRY